MAPSAVSHPGRCVHRCSSLVINTEKMTSPRVVDTDELERYALAGSPSLIASGSVSAPKAFKSSHSRTHSEGGILLRTARTKNEARLTRLANECLLDVSSPGVLKVLEDDAEWPCLGRSDNYDRPSLPPSPRLQQSASFTRFESGSPTFSSEPDLPSLFDDSQPSLSDDDISFSFSSIHTPFRRLRPMSGFPVTGCEDNTSSNSSSARPGLGFEVDLSNMGTSTPPALVGLGILGLTNDDGSPFNGLGTLPRVGWCSSPPPADYLDDPYAPWNLSGVFEAQRERRDATENWRERARADDFQRRLDEAIMRRSQAPKGRQEWRTGTAKKGNRRSMPLAPERGDVFSQASAEAGRSRR
ncbi:uncharacterized protein LAESUDRAFT_754257 [Laetiporus sulphureus 93-53]|uniref:Uncharacterized protein n=1 Tax=Laetiporus sulphureus 93-53 TaxID=1314785 RepID=A0A165IM23_9APHY|nr:uncharacterized protein LAESUDRAFT_754257 [Laetiporus sulphureus 93-53]KZT13268.1 hypothetical protein LAESUDRAFT_754257 [Laetiporus sulphureus 93-53]